MSTKTKKLRIAEAWKQMSDAKRAKWKLLNDMDKRRFRHVSNLRRLPAFAGREIDPTMALRMHELTGAAADDSSDESD